MADTNKKSGTVNTASPVTVLSGIGPARAEAYARIGVKTVGDLIFHIPRAYENRGDIRTLDASRTDGGKTAVVLTVSTVPTSARLRGRMTIVKFRAVDELGQICDLTFFNQPYLKSTFTLGSEWRFYGTVERKSTRSGTRYSMTSPVFEPWAEDRLPDFVPVYPLSEGLTQKVVASNVADAMRLCAAYFPDPLPDEIRQANNLCTLPFAIRNIHNPVDYADLARAKRRLVFDELFYFSLSMAQKHTRQRQSGAFPCTKQNISPLLKLLPYKLTGAQKRVITQIAADMRTDIPMDRIVIGDVGCGKTAVAAAAICIAVMSGRQAALMAPTEILARQHFSELSVLFGKLGISCELLIGATTAAEKRRIRSGLASSDPEKRISVVIGTHALISAEVEFDSLSLVVTDEQHRFGVNQRAALAAKAEHVHVLAMSATPIPRSLALALYGDTDVSKIDEMPAGRRKTDTFVVGEDYRERIIEFIRKQCADGGQVYVVCPSIEENPDNEPEDSGEVSIYDITDEGINKKPPLKAAVAYAEELQTRLPELTVAFVHGKLKSDQKDAIMTHFEAGDVQVLVSTTVIEVGVNVPNASLMIVENAERFGLSQLHQLRGRVGRGNRKSYCILVSDDKSAAAKRRLGVMRDTNDGFEIAEEDLKARGPGDFLRTFGSSGVRQSGGMRFRFADLCSDASVFASASESARILLESDPHLDSHPLLKSTISELIGEN